MNEIFEFAKNITRLHAKSVLTIEAQVKDCLGLARKLRDEPYSYDRDGKEEFDIDLQDLCDKLSLLEAEIHNGKE